jgi:hypothetical protein
MRLEPGVIRELHWHKEAEWAYVLSGELGMERNQSDQQLTLQRRGSRYSAGHRRWLIHRRLEGGRPVVLPIWPPTLPPGIGRERNRIPAGL